jgi:hypothetical protein
MLIMIIVVMLTMIEVVPRAGVEPTTFAYEAAALPTELSRQSELVRPVGIEPT